MDFLVWRQQELWGLFNECEDGNAYVDDDGCEDDNECDDDN